MSKLIAVAHRGYSQRYPENTRLSYEAAIDAGAHVVETDARITTDGRIIACHDPDLKRLAGLEQAVSRVHSDVIRKLDLGRGEPPAFLNEVLDLVRDRAQVLVDMKTTDLEAAQAVLDTVSQSGEGITVYTGVRSLEQMRFMKERNPNIHCVGLLADYAEIPRYRDGGAYAVRAWEDDLNHPEVLEALSGEGPVWVTAGYRSRGEAPGYITKKRLEKLEEIGVSAVLLNDPSLLTGKEANL